MPTLPYAVPNVDVQQPDLQVAPGSVADTMNKNALNNGGAALSFPPESIAYGTTFRFVQYSYQNQQTNAKFISSTKGAQIFLPLPAQLQMSQGITYEGVDAGVLGFALKSGGAATSSLIDMIQNGSQDVVSAGKSVGKIAKAIGSGAEYAIRKFADEKLNGAGSQIDQMTGTVVNPYNVATFRHSDPRSFQLSFMLIPRSADESKLIKHICDTFVWHSLPYKEAASTIQGASVGGQSMFLDMPDEVEIAFYGTQSLFQFARAVITSVNVNYAPYGTPSFFNDTTPTGVELQLGIQEIQQLTRDAFSNTGYSAGQTGTQFQDTNVDVAGGTFFNPPPGSNT